MNLKFWTWFRKRAEEKPVLPLSEKIEKFEKLGYFNGECPECGEHIGVWILKENSRKTAYCPACEKEIFEKVEAQVEWDRI